jgi:hypothetical protein
VLQAGPLGVAALAIAGLVAIWKTTRDDRREDLKAHAAEMMAMRSVIEANAQWLRTFAEKLAERARRPDG